MCIGAGRIHYEGPVRAIAIYQNKCHKIAITNQGEKRYANQITISIKTSIKQQHIRGKK